VDHAEAHELLADLALEPRLLAGVVDGSAPDSAALRAHLADCEECRNEFDGMRRTQFAIVDATATDAGGRGKLSSWAEDDPLRAPESLWSTVAAIPRTWPIAGPVEEPIAVAPAATRRIAGRGRLFTALAGVALVLVVGVTGMAADQVVRAIAAQGVSSELASLAGATSAVLADPDHVSFALTGLDGAAAGSAAWSGEDYVIMTRALQPPGPGTEYRCWLERDGVRIPIGAMRFGGDVAYWWGSVDVPPGYWRSGGLLGVSLERVGADSAGAPILVGRIVP
jgi:hypothetical protein